MGRLEDIRSVKLFSFLFPKPCLSCEKPLIGTELKLCTKCLAELPTTSYWLMPSDNPVYHTLAGRLPLQYAAAYCFFRKQSKIQHIMHALKYRGESDVGEAMGNLFGAVLQTTAFSEIDAIAPVPLHPSKLKRRGYNQAEVIAKGIAETMEKPMENSLIVRTKASETQTKKDREQRWANVSEIFEPHHQASLAGKHILLVDDVITTGATLEACGKALLQNGCSKISVATLAVASA